MARPVYPNFNKVLTYIDLLGETVRVRLSNRVRYRDEENTIPMTADEWVEVAMHLSLPDGAKDARVEDLPGG